MNGKVRFVAIASVAAILVACAPSVSVRTEKTAVPLPATCSPSFIELGEPVPPSAIFLAEVGVSDTGFSLDCGKDNAREVVRSQACLAGADTVRIVAVSEPNVLSDCYRIKAQLYKSGRSVPAPLAPSSSPDKIQRLKDLQLLRDKGTLTDEEFLRLKREIIEGHS